MAKTTTTGRATDEDLGVFEPEGPDPSASGAAIPALAAFRDCPSKGTHLEAARLLHRTGPLVLDGVLYTLVAGRVAVSGPSARRDVQSRVVDDDPREVLA